MCVGRGRTGGERIYMVKRSGFRAPVERLGPGPGERLSGEPSPKPATRQLGSCKQQATSHLGWLSP